jgi:hypothetical protein
MTSKNQADSKDKRYTITLEFCGYSTARYVARFCGEWLGKSDRQYGAWIIANQHKQLLT